MERYVRRLQEGKESTEVAYGITSCSPEMASAEQVLRWTRHYWGIENGLHYRRDVTLREDQTRMTKGNAGQIMACINNLVIGLLIGKQKFKYLPSARRHFNAHPLKAFELIVGL